jgi:Fe-S cluster assembly protein SufD
MSSVVERGNTETRTDRYVAEFEALKDRRPAGPPWVARLRQEAIGAFAARGFPTTRDEEYRFTNVAPIASTAFNRAPEGAVEAEAVNAHLFPEAVADLVFVNGRFAPALSRVEGLPAGLTVTTLAEALVERPDEIEPFYGRLAESRAVAFSALNTAFADDGAVVMVAPHAVVEAPVNLVFVSTSGATPVVSYPRVLLLAGEHSQSRFIETHLGLGEGTYFSCAVSEVSCAESAVVDYYRVQIEESHGFHYCRLAVSTSRASTFLSHAFSLGGAIVRNDLNAVMEGEGGDCTLNGLYLADGETLVDNHTTIDHTQPHCGSHEVYKGILGGRARGVFNGKIVVRQDAQKTDAKQTNKALLLSGAAQINTKPQLEIFADDVKCTHGATVGQLDPDSLFYLRSRGLGVDAARALLIRGFAGDIVNRVAFQPLRDRLDARLLAQIPRDSVV